MTPRERQRKLSEVAGILTSGSAPDLESVASLARLDVEDLVQILEDPKFQDLVQSFTRARALILFNGTALSKLQVALDSPDPRLYTAALKLLGQISGDIKPKKKEVEVKLNFEGLLQQARPMPQLPPAIDAEPADSEDPNGTD